MILWACVFLLCYIFEFFFRRGYFSYLSLLAGINFLWFSHSSSMTQCLVFFGLGAVVCYCWYQYRRRSVQPWEKSSKERSPKKYIHDIFTLTHPIYRREGKITLDGSLWLLRADEDIPAGSSVRVKRTSGVFLHVERLIA